ncbi:MAG: deoxyhypusine synthase family protein [Planctomycetota bacterium]|nr:deoxyhypusine synthase family protein [Planctomycetota bacterium]
MKARQYLHRKVRPFEIKRPFTVASTLARMRDISFQGRNLATAVDVWMNAIADGATIFFGLAGAMVPAGMRSIVVYLIKSRLVDCIVSTGANLFHDCHESLGRAHYIGSPNVDDKKLLHAGVDRIYDTFAREADFRLTDGFIADTAALLQKRPHTTREFLFELGRALARGRGPEGILSAAFRAKLPLYCPAIGDSSIGIALAAGLNAGSARFLFDPVADVRETAEMAIKARRTAVIYVGGGTPKNFIQQTEVTASIMGHDVPGHEYAVQFTCDSPQWGGLSGCTFEEAQSWGKIAQQARQVTVHCDATIALPFVVSALAELGAASRRRRSRKRPH